MYRTYGTVNILKLQVQRIEIRCYKINRADGSTIKSRMDKIFQPFFTTKPTGQACPPLFIRWRTRLSLSYDIVKAHGGEIKVNTKCNEDLHAEETGTEFTIQLPI